MTALQHPERKEGVTSEQDRIALIKSTIAKDATDDELKLFLYQCQRTGLDPLNKQIYFQKRWNRSRGKSEMTVITGIDGYRLIADRTGTYAGNDDPVFDDERNPSKATVTVHKLIGGIRCPFTSSARWDQYYPGDELGFMWRKMPHLMLGKCAEALALRKAFPAELSGVYIKEEMDQADRVEMAASVVTITPAPPPPPPPSDEGRRRAPAVRTAPPEESGPERYRGSPEHCRRVRELAKPLGIVTYEELTALGKVLLGPPAVEMEFVEAAIRQHAKGRRP